MGGQDLAFVAQGEAGIADLALESGDFKADNGLETAVLVSLFTDRFVPFADLPENVEDPRGWWADALSDVAGDRIGSRLWLVFDRGKLDVNAQNDAKDYAEEALAWLVDVGLASRVIVETSVATGVQLTISVRIFRPTGDSIPFKYIWDGQALKRG